MNSEITTRPPVPPFTEETARQKVQSAEDAWNTRDPERVALAYSEDTEWRNRSEFLRGRAEVVQFLRRKWNKELDYRLKKELWAFHGNRIAVRFEYEWHDDSGQWYRSYGNENWEFDERGLMKRPLRQHQRPSHPRIRSQVPLIRRPTTKLLKYSAAINMERNLGILRKTRREAP
jgi:nuclear transport factor 2 (NTF2) superfamily protein